MIFMLFSSFLFGIAAFKGYSMVSIQKYFMKMNRVRRRPTATCFTANMTMPLTEASLLYNNPMKSM